MKTKNHIKASNTDTIKGIGKLGRAESGKMHSTIKRLITTFSTEKIFFKKENKKIVICPVCKLKLKSNNLNKIPDHKDKRFWYSKLDNVKNVCLGSWSHQKSDFKIVTFIEETSSGLGRICVGDKILLDFSRVILQEFDDRYKNLVESTLYKIERIDILKNSGGIYCYQELLHFDNIAKPIPNHISIFQHCIKL